MTSDNELAKTFSPTEVEGKWYEIWEKEGHFRPKAGKAGKSFTILMPPPNVTGILHMGHALDATTQDVLIRYKRMKGFETLYIPGTDHAGIATQAKVEEKLWKEEKKTKDDIGREKFLEMIWDWKKEHGDFIVKQQRKLGISADWEYATFTMDETPNRAVREAFVDWYNQGLIYQDEYIVNWDPGLQSAISDAEVDHKEVNGNFYHILYQIEGTDERVEIATTRPETLLGDTAVAVNPEDERFKHLIGKMAIVPIVNRSVKIIADEHVAIDKGTGCLKVTPGHDFNDFEIGKRHGLPIINILNADGTINSEGKHYEGMSCKETRKAIVKELKELELFVKTEPTKHQVGHGQRSGEVIEPMVSKQWFLNVQEMAKVSVEAVENDDMKFYPKGWENTYFAWMREPKNWCISRQLWWGHKIPVYYCRDCEHQWANIDSPSECPKCQSKNIFADPDVLDTWFSSGLWPLSTLGWPDPKLMQEKGFEKFFPGDVLVTGFDIIFFWVARMMMMSLKIKNQVPFKHTYIHAIVRDKNGVKMSKSLGNVIDPLEVVKEYGCDALRFTLAASSGYNRNINLDPAKIEGYRNFINKLWNAYRFIFPFINEAENQLPKELDHHDRWILSEYNQMVGKTTVALETYRFDEACSQVYAFVYDKFCSWYIELSKSVLYKGTPEQITRRSSVLRFLMKEICALLHPFSPYITEEIWSQLKGPNDPLLIASDYPEENSELDFPSDQEQMGQFMEIIKETRNLRQSVNLPPKQKIDLYLFNDAIDQREYLESNQRFIQSLAGVESVFLAEKSAETPKKSLSQATSHTNIYIPVEGLVDIDEQVAKSQKQIDNLSREVKKLQGKLSNEKFVANAPKEVVEESRNKLEDFQFKIDALEKIVASFKTEN